MEQISVFVSYARTDDEADGGSFGRVTTFLNALRIELARYGHEDKIRWVDQDTEDSSTAGASLELAGQSQIFVPLLSPTYLESEYAAAELHQFIEHQGFDDNNTSALIPVELLPSDRERWPQALAGTKTQPLYGHDYNGETYPLMAHGDTAQAYWRGLANIAAVIADQLPALDGFRDPESGLPLEGRPMWLCQYRRSEAPEFEQRLLQGQVLNWKTHPFGVETLQAEMAAGDDVVLWRTRDEQLATGTDGQTGGIVGWATVHESNLEALKSDAVALEVVEAFPDEPFDRQLALGTLSGVEEMFTGWPGQVSLKRLSDEARRRLDFLALQYGEPDSRPVWPTADSDAPRPNFQTELSSDEAKTSQDSLGRAPIAFAMAHYLNRVWSEQTKDDSEPHKAALADKNAFILHIDAPWGGGKTTFTNFVSRILNPRAHGFGGADLTSRSHPLFGVLRLTEPEYWPAEFREREWITVNFNAWQHQHVKPPWWNFYDAIRVQCLTALPVDEFVQRWVAEKVWRICTPELLRTVGMLFVVYTVILLATLSERGQQVVFGKTPSQTIEMPAASAPDARPRSNQTAAAGRAASDNRSAARGAGIASETAAVRAPAGNEPERADVPKAEFVLALLLLLGGSGAALIKAFRLGVRRIVESAAGSPDSDALGQIDPLNRFRRHFTRLMHRFKRPVLVVVDDLDRCEPAFVVELVRGMLTIFRSPRVVFVLLGDKRWLEGSFANVHDAMKHIHDDKSISFGGRFAEKAIQLSFVLPEPDDTNTDDYLASLLKPGRAGSEQLRSASDDANRVDGERPGTDLPDDTQAQLAMDIEREIKASFKAASSESQRAKIVSDTLARVRSQLNSEELAERTLRVMNREAAMRAASSERTDLEIRHAIAELADVLPRNPRRIKRIVNTIAMYQASAQVSLGVAPDSREWRQLALWIVLMLEYPGEWHLLCGNPERADDWLRPDVSEPLAARAELEEAAGNFAPGPGVLKLMRGDLFQEGDCPLNSQAIQLLRRLTPPT